MCPDLASAGVGYKSDRLRAFGVHRNKLLFIPNVPQGTSFSVDWCRESSKEGPGISFYSRNGHSGYALKPVGCVKRRGQGSFRYPAGS